MSAKCYDGVLLELLFGLMMHALLDQLHCAGQRSRRLAGSLQASSNNCYMICYWCVLLVRPSRLNFRYV